MFSQLLMPVVTLLCVGLLVWIAYGWEKKSIRQANSFKEFYIEAMDRAKEVHGNLNPPFTQYDDALEAKLEAFRSMVVELRLQLQKVEESHDGRIRSVNARLNDAIGTEAEPIDEKVKEDDRITTPNGIMSADEFMRTGGR